MFRSRTRLGRELIECGRRYCELYNWGSWGKYDRKCGGSGMQSRHRFASQTTWCKSNECIGDSVQKRSCNRMCYNGGRLMGGGACTWNDWGQWGECDRQCGGSGTQLRRRYKQQEESCEGNKCHGDSEEKRSCNRLCHNGGTLWNDGTCHCTNQYHGQCCEHCKARNCV